MVDDRIIAEARRDHVGATSTVDRIRARAARQRVRCGGTRDGYGRCQRRCVGVLEVRDVDGIAARLIGTAEIDGDIRFEHEGVGADRTINGAFRAPVGDRVVAGASVDVVCAAAAVDGISAPAGLDRIRRTRPGDRECRSQDAGVEALEIADRDGIANCLVGPGCDREIHRGEPACGCKHKHVGTGTAIDRRFSPLEGDAVVTPAGRDHIRAAGPVDGVRARPADDRICRGRSGDRDCGGKEGGINVLVVRDRDRIANRLVSGAQIDRRRTLHHQRIDAGAAVDGVLRAVVGNRVVAAAGSDRVESATAIDGIGARTSGDRIGADRTRHDERRRQRAGVEIFKIDDTHGVACGLIEARADSEIDGRDAARSGKDQRVAASPAIHGAFCSVVDDRIVATAACDAVSAAATVDRIGARATDDHIGRIRAGNGDRRRQCRGVDVLEV